MGGGRDWGRESTCPVPARLVPGKETAFLQVGSVDLHFFGRDGRKGYICNVENPIALIGKMRINRKEERDKEYLRLGIPVVDCVDEAVGAKAIAKLQCELSPTLWGVGFG